MLSAIVRWEDPEAGAPVLWRFDATTRQRADLDAGGRITTAYAPEPHGWAACPLLRLASMPEIVPGIADIHKAMVIGKTWLDRARIEARNPIILGVGWNNTQEFNDLISKFAGVIAANDPNADIKAINLDTGTPDGIAEDLVTLEAQLYRVAKVQPVASGTAESGIARAYRFLDADAELAAVAEACRSTEQAAWDIVAATFGVRPPVVGYPTTFAPRDRASDTVAADAVIRSSLPQSIKQAVVNDLAATHYPSVDPESIQLEPAT